MDLAERLRTCLSDEPDIAAAYLFGSAARGTATARSDVDVAVIFAKDLSPEARRMAGFRDVIVHDYVRIEAEIVHQVLRRNLGDLESFLAAVASRYVPDTAAEPKTGGPSL